MRALTATIAAELGETPVGSEHYRALFTLGILLFAVTFVINLLADVMVRGRAPGARLTAARASAPPTPPNAVFQATPLTERNRRRELQVKSLFLLATVLLVVPVVAVLGILIWRGGAGALDRLPAHRAARRHDRGRHLPGAGGHDLAGGGGADRLGADRRRRRALPVRVRAATTG